MTMHQKFAVIQQGSCGDEGVVLDNGKTSVTTSVSEFFPTVQQVFLWHHSKRDSMVNI